MYQIILCEKATGIILELDGKTRYQAIEENMCPTLSFETLKEAEEKAHDLLKSNIDLEITINSNGEFIKRIV